MDYMYDEGSSQSKAVQHKSNDFKLQKFVKASSCMPRSLGWQRRTPTTLCNHVVAAQAVSMAALAPLSVPKSDFVPQFDWTVILRSAPQLYCWMRTCAWELQPGTKTVNLIFLGHVLLDCPAGSGNSQFLLGSMTTVVHLC